MPPIITLLTDFGLSDAYVGMMKGVILKINPRATIIDLTHDISPQNIEQAAFVINTSYAYFPKNTIHVIVVDPGVGSDRKIIALEINGHIFLAPDNGVLTSVMAGGEINTAIEVTNTDCFLETVSNTFHGRDIFAPVAGHISKTGNLMQAGRPIDSAALKKLDTTEPEITGNRTIEGRIIHADHFGNLITNIHRKVPAKTSLPKKGGRITIELNGKKIIGISKTYADSNKNEPLALFGSSDYLEIAVNCGCAKTYFNASPGDTITLK